MTIRDDSMNKLSLYIDAAIDFYGKKGAEKWLDENSGKLKMTAKNIQQAKDDIRSVVSDNSKNVETEV